MASSAQDGSPELEPQAAVRGSSRAGRRYHPSRCRVCNADRADGVHISATGLCPTCGDIRELANHRQLKAHTGPFWDWWRIRSLAALGDLGALLDTAPPGSDTPG